MVLKRINSLLEMVRMKCRKCNVELTDKNWHKSRQKEGSRLCNSCMAILSKEWRSKNKERDKTNKHLWKKNNKEKTRIYQKEYLKDYQKRPHIKDQTQRRYKQYLKNNKLKYLEYWAKRNGKGYVPLNDYYDGADGHHIDKEQIIFMPMFIHRSIPHHHKDPESMKVINLWAIFWLIYGHVETIEMKIPAWVFNGGNEKYRQTTLI